MSTLEKLNEDLHYIEENLADNIKKLLGALVVRNIILRECFLSSQALAYRNTSDADASPLQHWSLLIVISESSMSLLNTGTTHLMHLQERFKVYTG